MAFNVPPWDQPRRRRDGLSREDDVAAGEIGQALRRALVWDVLKLELSFCAIDSATMWPIVPTR